MIGVCEKLKICFYQQLMFEKQVSQSFTAIKNFFVQAVPLKICQDVLTSEKLIYSVFALCFVPCVVFTLVVVVQVSYSVVNMFLKKIFFDYSIFVQHMRK